VAINGIAIPEEMPRLTSPGRRLDQLAPHPGGSRIGRDVHVHQRAAVMGDEDQDVQRLERQGRHGQEIRRPEMVGVVGQEMVASSGSAGAPARASGGGGWSGC